MRNERGRDRPNAIYFLMRQLGGESGDWALLGLGFGAGALAFLWAGYLGYLTPPAPPPGAPGWQYIFAWLQREPWSLFAFYCLMTLMLEASILLDPSLPAKWKPSRARVTATLSVTGVCILIVSVAHVVGGQRIAEWIRQIAPALASVGTWIGQNRQVVFSLANLACLIILWLGIRYATYDPEAEDGGGARGVRSVRTEFRGERLTGDLALTACFSVMLAWAFFAPFWQNSNLLVESAHPLGGGKSALTVCDLTFLPYRSPCALGPFDFTTIFFLDLIIIPLICACVILITLGIAAWHEALERGQAEEFPSVFIEVLLDVLRRRLTLPNLLLALRYIWPLLLLLATVLIGMAASATLAYLVGVGLASHGDVFWLNLDWNLLRLQFSAAAELLIAVVATVSATTLQIFPRVWERASLRRELALSWRHVRFLTLMLIVSYWVFSLIFSIINGLALIVVREVENVTNATWNGLHWAPFIQPDPLMLLSLAVFLLVAARWPQRRVASQRPNQPSQDAAG